MDPVVECEVVRGFCQPHHVFAAQLFETLLVDHLVHLLIQERKTPLAVSSPDDFFGMAHCISQIGFTRFVGLYRIMSVLIFMSNDKFPWLCLLSSDRVPGLLDNLVFFV